MQRRQSELFDGVNRVMKRAAKAGGSEAIERTRVDTGKARSNWLASLDTPDSRVVGPHSPGVKLGKGERVNADAARIQQENVINGYAFLINNSIFITNNVEYASVLNNGRASLPPDNMLEFGAQAALIILQNPGNLLK